MTEIELLLQQLNRQIDALREYYMDNLQAYVLTTVGNIGITLEQMKDNMFITEDDIPYFMDDIFDNMTTYDITSFKEVMNWKL